MGKRSQTKHTEVSFKPLRTSCNLRCITPASPCSQASNSITGEYEPDRSATPCCVYPEIKVYDPDGVFPGGNANSRLSLDSLKWMVNGVEISSLASSDTTWKDKYAVLKNADEYRGVLQVYRNVLPSEQFSLQFEGKFYDFRTGTNYTVVSDKISLSTTDKGEDIFSCSADVPKFVYDPLDDNLLLYDYLNAKGIFQAGTRDERIDGKCYLHKVNVAFLSGINHYASLPEGVTMQVCYAGSESPLTEESEDSPEIDSASYPLIEFDCRMIDSKDYVVRFMKGDRELCHCSISIVKAVFPDIESSPNSGADIVVGQRMYFNTANIRLRDRTVPYLELYFLIKWFTQAMVYDGSSWEKAEAVERNTGEKLEVGIEDIGVGKTKNDSYFDVWFDTDWHSPLHLLSDENGNTLTDGNNDLIG